MKSFLYVELVLISQIEHNMIVNKEANITRFSGLYEPVSVEPQS